MTPLIALSSEENKRRLFHSSLFDLDLAGWRIYSPDVKF